MSYIFEDVHSNIINLEQISDRLVLVILLIFPLVYEKLLDQPIGFLDVELANSTFRRDDVITYRIKLGGFIYSSFILTSSANVCVLLPSFK